MTPAELRALLAAATPEPWQNHCGVVMWSTATQVDRDLIVALRNNAEKLIAVVEAAEAYVAAQDFETRGSRLRAALTALREGGGT